jgi:hypothetical protein
MKRITALLVLVASVCSAQRIAGYHYEESEVKPYVLPDPLVLLDGQKVTTSQVWWNQRRPEIVKLFEKNVFGRVPQVAQHVPLRYKVVEKSGSAFGGKAVRRRVDVYLTPRGERGAAAHLLLYLPAHAKHKVAVIEGLSFGANFTISNDPDVPASAVWTKAKDEPLPKLTMPEESKRGSQTQEWQVEKVIDRGYGLATIYYGDIEPDFKDSMQLGVRQSYLHDGETAPAADEWGALSAWGWGLSRVMDYLATDKDVDAKRVVVTGHSRLGKTADWAVAMDPRFAGLLSTESGKGGQSIYRRGIGETIEHLQHSFPYWFCANYAQWLGRDSEIPVEGNLLLALVAPRPVYAASAVQDEWSDPKGEFLSAVSVSRVYELLGKKGLPVTATMPGVNEPIGLDGYVAYHERSGKHDVTAYDWDEYLDFLDARFGRQ